MAHCEIKRDGVFPGRHRNRVGEVPPPLALSQFRIVGPASWRWVGCHLAALKINVWTPPVAVVGVIGRLPGKNAHRAHVTTEPGRSEEHTSELQSLRHL